MKNKYLSLLFLILILGLLFFSDKAGNLWYKHFPKGGTYGKEFNTERHKRGILPIPEDWTTKDYGSHSKTWSPNKDQVRNMKIVSVENGRIDSEINYLSFEGQALEIIYSYTDEKIGSDPWEIHLQSNNERIPLTREEKGSVLFKWRVLSSKGADL